MASPDTATPMFVLWSLAQPCDLRTPFDSWEEPERTERTLRALQELARARCDGRVFKGFALHPELSPSGVMTQPALAFSVEEIYLGFGGETFVHDFCRSCPANVALNGEQIAGCFEMIYQWGTPDIEQAFEAAIAEIGVEQLVKSVFPPTSPSFFGVWMPTPFSQTQLELLRQIIERVIQKHQSPQLETFIQAIEASLSSGVPLHAELFPPGELAGRSWKLPPHCRACKAVRTDSAKQCPFCGNNDRPYAPKPRNARGVRPYMNLADLIGQEQVADLLRRYLQSRSAGNVAIGKFFERNARWLPPREGSPE